MRDEKIIIVRPLINTDLEKVSLNFENFQNTTLRPILKFQNDLIMDLFLNFNTIEIPKNALEKEIFVKNIIQKNIVLKNKFIGLIIGLFTKMEFEFYLNNQTEVNKRISQLITKRIIDQI
jgi:hypothetical protein